MQQVHKRALRHTGLRRLALDWALDERARDLTPAFDPDTDKPEHTILALAGAIRQHLGDQDAQDWLEVVMASTVDEATRQVAVAIGNPAGQSARPSSLWNATRSPDWSI